MACDEKAANLWAARVIPAILFGIVGYSTYVVVVRVCGVYPKHSSFADLTVILSAGLVDYLLRPLPPVTHEPRSAAAIVVLVLYFLFLIPVAVCYFRLLQTIASDPGYIPRGPQWHEGLQERNSQPIPQRRVQWWRPSAVPQEKSGHQTSNPTIESGELIGRGYAQTNAVSWENDVAALQTGLEEFWAKDTFVCDAEGRPKFCSTCLNFKTDRAHHCKEVGRCVRKMDHYCPW